MINYFSKYKFFFYLCNFILIILYLYPGSILGWFLYNDISLQPQITQNLNLSLSQRSSFVKPKSKAGRLKSKDTTIGLQYTKKFDF